MKEHKNKAPGIAVLGALAIVWGIGVWLTGLSHGAGRLAAPGAAPGFRLFLVSDDLWVNLRFYAFAAPPLIAGVGVLMRKRWARVLYIVFASMMICYAVFNTIRDIVDGERFLVALGFLAFFVVTFGIPIWYFFRSKVREQFN